MRKSVPNPPEPSGPPSMVSLPPSGAVPERVHSPMTTSLPGPALIVSLPGPPQMMSFPPKPLIVSLPARPTIRSGPAVPLRLSLPLVPWMTLNPEAVEHDSWLASEGVATPTSVATAPTRRDRITVRRRLESVPEIINLMTVLPLADDPQYREASASSTYI